MVVRIDSGVSPLGGHGLSLIALTAYKGVLVSSLTSPLINFPQARGQRNLSRRSKPRRNILIYRTQGRWTSLEQCLTLCSGSIAVPLRNDFKALPPSQIYISPLSPMQIRLDTGHEICEASVESKDLQDSIQDVSDATKRVPQRKNLVS